MSSHLALQELEKIRFKPGSGHLRYKPTAIVCASSAEIDGIGMTWDDSDFEGWCMSFEKTWVPGTMIDQPKRDKSKLEPRAVLQTEGG